MSISFNIHGHNVKDKNRLIDRLKRNQPEAVFVLDNLDLAQQIKRALPDKTVIFREFEGGKSLHKDVDPVQWLDGHIHQATGGITLNVLNEPPFDQECIDWLLKLCIRAVEKNVRVCVGNWAAGNPTGDPAKEWPKAFKLLAFADKHREYISIGLHEYFAAVPTSGLIGGNPTMIRAGEWPAIVPFTRWHCGRFQFMLNYCYSVNIKPPRIFVTECGADNLPDVGAWLKTLKRIAPDKEPRSWKSLVAQWREWYPQWSAERAYFEMLKWLDQTIYKGSPVECQMIFSYGHSSAQWADFDLEDAAEFHQLLETYSASQKADDMTFPLPTDPKWKQETNLSGKKYDVLKTLTAPTPAASILPGESFWSYPGLGEQNAIIVKALNGQIGYCDKTILRVAPSPLPEPEPPPVIDLKHSLDAIKILIGRKEDELQEANHVVSRIDTELKLLRIVLSDLESIAADSAA